MRNLATSALVLAMSIAGLACDATPPAQAAEKQADKGVRKARTVKIQALAHEDFRSKIRASGTALPVREGFLSASVPGRVKEILVKRGERVTKGQPLLRLDRSGFYLGVQQAEAGLAAARVGVSALETEMNRFNRLLAKKAVPRASYDKIKAQYDGALAQVAMAEVGLKQARKALTDTELKAPYDGVITMVLKTIGEYAPAMPPTMLFQIVDTSSLEVQVFLPERQSSMVQVGKDATVQLESAGVTRKGKVIFVSDRIQPGSQTFEVRIGLDNSDGLIKSGAFARVSMVKLDTKEGLLIPLRAVVRDESGQTFAFINESNKAVRKAISLGDTRSDRVLVTEGLSKGQQVIITGVSDLKDGETIAADAG